MRRFRFHIGTLIIVVLVIGIESDHDNRQRLDQDNRWSISVTKEAPVASPLFRRV